MFSKLLSIYALVDEHLSDGGHKIDIEAEDMISRAIDLHDDLVIDVDTPAARWLLRNSPSLKRYPRD